MSGALVPETRGALNVVPNVSEDKVGGNPVNYNENGDCIFAYGYHVTRGCRPANEDRISVTPCMAGNSKLNFYGVYDGHCGDKASSFCATEIPKNVMAGMCARDGKVSEVDALDLFTDAFKACDAQLGGMEDGTTACTVLVAGEQLYIASAGDSQAVLCRLGTPVTLNSVHKVTDARERKRVEANGGKIETINGVERIDGLLNMSRALGNHRFRDVGVICNPSVNSRKLTKGDDFLILATDGLWSFVAPGRACQVLSTASSEENVATTLVNLALHHGSTDNISVVVVDLRPLFDRNVLRRSMSGAEGTVPFNIPQKVAHMADKILENVDLLQVPVEYSGWMLKESRSGILGKRWQKRFFVLQVVEDGMVSKDASMHTSSLKVKLFVLHYHDSEEASKKQNPKKLVIVNPSAGVSRQEMLDKPGRVCVKFSEATSGEPFVLGAANIEQALNWICNVNKVFKDQGYNPETPPKKSHLTRTLSEMEDNAPHIATDVEGRQITIPTGNFIGGQFTGPAPFTRTADGGLAVLGGGWKRTAAELVEIEQQSLMGLPPVGHMFNDMQSAALNIPKGSVLVRSC